MHVHENEQWHLKPFVSYTVHSFLMCQPALCVIIPAERYSDRSVRKQYPLKKKWSATAPYYTP